MSKEIFIIFVGTLGAFGWIGVVVNLLGENAWSGVIAGVGVLLISCGAIWLIDQGEYYE